MTRSTTYLVLILAAALAAGACKKKSEEPAPEPVATPQAPAVPEPAKAATPTAPKPVTPEPAAPVPPPTPEPAAPPPPVHTASVCTGSGYTCFLKAAGDVLCVGDNIDGQLGDGTATNRALPTPVADLAGVMELACGASHACARREDGSVMCWGQSWHGELGCGSKDATQTPVAVKDLTGVKQLALGYAFSCALRDDGKVSCWGLGSEGQLGREATDSSDVPVEIAGLDGVAEIAAGFAHVCARKESGEVLCWGQSDERLGRGETAGSGWSPMPVANLTGAKAIGAGNDHSCALTATGLFCWGGNYAGELGNGQKGYDQSSKVPVQVPDVGAGVQQIVLRGDHSCVRLESGEVKCWGDINLGLKLADVAEDVRDVQKAAALLEMSDAAYLAVGDYGGCIIRKAGQLVCFGSGNYGIKDRDYEAVYQVVAPDLEKLTGEAPVRYTFAPSADATLHPIPHLSAGHEFVCGVRENGKIYCFGGGGSGELGCGSSRYRGSSEGCEVGGISDGVQVSATLTQACALRANGQVACWGGMGSITTGLPIPIEGVTGATKLDIGGTAGATEACAVLADKTVACWAAYANSSLLAGQTFVDARTAVAIPGVTDVEQLAVGYDAACYINTEGKVLCWGDAYHGALGRDTEEDTAGPVEVPRLSRATHIAGNGYNFCVVHSGGKLTCWGMNDEGQIGNGKTDAEKPALPTEVRGVRGAVASVVGSGTTCALLQNGEAMCWGSNPWNECGINDSENDAILKPSQVLRTQDPTVGAWGPFAGLATGLRFGCAVHADGNVSCWGDTPITSPDNVLGTGSTRTGFPVPAPGITFPPPATELVPAA